jgi:hypothetical protein
VGEEPLRAVLDALAHRGPGEQASVQLVITEATGLRAWLARTLPATRAGRRRGIVGGLVRAAAPALLGTLAGALAAAIVGLLDFLGPSPFSTRTPTARVTSRASIGFAGSESRAIDPGLAAARRAAEIKRASAHLHATLRVAVSTAGPEPAPGRRGRRGRRRGGAGAAAAIAAGFDLATTHTPLRARPARCAETVYLRTPGDGFPVTLAELAALWHLPTEPLLYRIAAPTAGDRGPGLGHSRITPNSHRPNTPPPRTPPAEPGDTPSNPAASPPPPTRSGGADRATVRELPARPGAGTRPSGPLSPTRPPTPTRSRRVQPGAPRGEQLGEQMGEQRRERRHGGEWQ